MTAIAAEYGILGPTGIPVERQKQDGYGSCNFGVQAQPKQRG